MNRLYLVRHGENWANITKEFSYKKVDYSLTPKGVLQAQQTAAYFVDKDIHAIYSSPLKRALETATIIGNASGRAVVVLENFREVNVGALEDSPPSTESWDLHFRVVADWLAGKSTTSFPQGEDYSSLWRRLREGLAQILPAAGEGNIVIVGHGGLFTYTMQDLCPGTDVAALRRRQNHNCSITEVAVELQDGIPVGRLIAWGSCAHLYGQAAEVVSGVPASYGARV